MTRTALEQGCELDEVADTPVVSGSRKKNENTELQRQSFNASKNATPSHSAAGADGPVSVKDGRLSKCSFIDEVVEIP